ncbi:uncharacterized protein AB9X84_005780 [Acanthopagrus schlegelii]
MTPAVELALHLNEGRPVTARIQGRTVTDSVPATETVRFIQVSGNMLILLEPPEDDPAHLQLQNALLQMRRLCHWTPDSLRLHKLSGLYAKHLEKQIELADVKFKLKQRKIQEMEQDLEIKCRTLRKLDLEIQKLEREDPSNQDK